MASTGHNHAAHVNRTRLCAALPCLLVLAVVTSSCGDDDKSKTSSASTACTADVIEADLAADPLAGPLVDPATGKLELTAGKHYVVSSTYGVPRPGSDGAQVTEHYQALFGAIQAQLAQQPGLLAMTLGQSDSCHSGRTLAVWSSEDEMYSFVTSKAHTDAMNAVSEVLQPGYAVTHWDASSADDMTFKRAGRELAADAKD
jgi:heme-degrading monooxygenase HmoA